jgi:spore cortex formation protein SpoVR/YcgB (stage V sporulation)
MGKQNNFLFHLVRGSNIIDVLKFKKNAVTRCLKIRPRQVEEFVATNLVKIEFTSTRPSRTHWRGWWTIISRVGSSNFDRDQKF